MRNLRSAYLSQRATARERGIEFLLTYLEWVSVWEESGHLDERGPAKYQYCMSRFGDMGPYAIGNVRIITNAENRSEQRCSEATIAFLKKPRTIEQRLKVSKSLKGRIVTASHREKISKSLTGIKRSEETKAKVGNARRGKKDSEESRKRKSESAKRRYAKSNDAILEKETYHV